MFWKLMKAWGEQVFIALDQLANASTATKLWADSRWSACGKTAPAGGTSFKGPK